MRCVDLGESFQTQIYLQNLASTQPRTSPVKFARSPRTDPPGSSPPQKRQHFSWTSYNSTYQAFDVRSAGHRAAQVFNQKFGCARQLVAARAEVDKVSHHLSAASGLLKLISLLIHYHWMLEVCARYLAAIQQSKEISSVFFAVYQ